MKFKILAGGNFKYKDTAEGALEVIHDKGLYTESRYELVATRNSGSWLVFILSDGQIVKKVYQVETRGFGRALEVNFESALTYAPKKILSFFPNKAIVAITKYPYQKLIWIPKEIGDGHTLQHISFQT